jgi:signal transduction histidine kinase
VSLRHEGGFACIAVADDGPGVPTELRARLFTPFFTTRAQGTGLGLAIVRRVADAHGGEARLLEGPTGQGATFVLRLPLEPPAAAARSA